MSYTFALLFLSLPAITFFVCKPKHWKLYFCLCLIPVIAFILLIALELTIHIHNVINQLTT